LADVNDRLLHCDGDMSRYFIDNEQKSCLDTDEDYTSDLESFSRGFSMAKVTAHAGKNPCISYIYSLHN
jgi:hypothetical protein